MSTIKTFCQFCGTYCGDISIYDAPYTGEPICHDCNEAEDNAKMISDMAVL